jgi:arsenate reductase (glutaredoxin)
LEILRDRGVEFDVIEYIKSPPSEALLRRFVKLLQLAPADMLHPGSFAKLGRDINEIDSEEALIALLLAHPEVMNRPICLRGDRAVIARPAEKVNEILD